MEATLVFQDIAIALGLGLLVGLQRERAVARLAGIRTFALVTLLGAVTAQLSGALGLWMVVAGFVGVAIMIGIGNVMTLRTGSVDPGQTTEIAALLMYTVGAYVVLVSHEGGVVIGGTVAILLYLKEGLHRFAGELGEGDLKAIMQFALLSLVILPVLPNATFGPYAVLNPRQIWLMVVLIVGIGLAGYVAYKAFGTRTGALLAGILGGVISSTATTVSYARRSVTATDQVLSATLVIALASSVVFIRITAEIGIVAPEFLSSAGPPLAVLFGTFVLLALGLWFFGTRDHNEMPLQENPSELKPALVFGALYAAILLAVAAGQEHFGERGLYAVAAISGLTDLDAITLSTSRLVDTGQLEAALGTRAIVIAALSNLVFKTAVIALLGTRELLVRVAAIYATAFAVGLGLLAVM